ncbi:MAG: thiamine-phosphate kinase [Dethiobacter sp.]|jgi:thiamine-monophosphate kinase|nr:MAG: thiamine-phosphate kinase [Dethiobacter sp.]
MKGNNLRIKDIGEFALIERLVEVLGPAGRGAGQGVIRGIGDDAAVLQNNPGTRLLASCDMLVEGIHFDLSYFTPRQLGWKALVANLSDIAAMGGRPRWALVSLGLKPEMKVSFVEEIYAGIAELAGKFGVTIVGGDTCSSPERLVIDICILGEAYRAEVAYRSGAHEGDLILVTGKLGAAAAGLAYLREGGKAAIDGAEELRQAHLKPVPRVKEAAILIHSGMVGAMNDISDGLASELHEIVQASGCGARIWTERLPISQATALMAAHTGVNPLDWALYGGEDYELLLTISGEKGSPLKARKLGRTLAKATGTPLNFIGRILPLSGTVEMVRPDGEIEPLLPEGYNHFKE